MSARGATVRLMAGLMLALAMAAAITPFAGGRVAAQENASITIYTAICPVGYTGDTFFEDCYDTPGANIEYILTGPTFPGGASATTDASGFTAFEGIDQDGLYTLQIQVPGDFADFVARCSAGGEDFPFTYGDLFGEIDLDLTTADDLRCDFYVIPIDQVGDQASITLYKAVCPVGYEDDNYFEDCFDSPLGGVTFTLTNEETDESVDATTGDDGFTAFEGLGGGSYLLGEDIPGDFNDIFVLCSKGGESFPFEYVEGGFIALELTTDDDIRCDWYNIPTDAQGPTATTAPTKAPTQAPATSTVATLPSTGVGGGNGGGSVVLPLAAAALLLVVGGAGLFATRARLSRVGARAPR